MSVKKLKQTIEIFIIDRSHSIKNTNVIAMMICVITIISPNIVYYAASKNKNKILMNYSIKNF